MAFLGMGWTELLVILVIVLIIFGPKQLPKLGQTFGKTVRSVREGMAEADAEMNADSGKQINAAEDAEDVEVEEVKPAESSGDAAGDTRTPAKHKFCPECGAKNPRENKFCSECGNKLQ